MAVPPDRQCGGAGAAIAAYTITADRLAGEAVRIRQVQLLASG